MQKDRSIIARIQGFLLDRSTAYAVLFAFLILLSLSCATMGIQPGFVYGGF